MASDRAEDHIQALADNVRQLRERFGLSLAQLSDRSGIAKATLFKIEQGRTNPTLDTITAIAVTFDISVAALIQPNSGSAVEVIRAGEGEDTTDDASVSHLLRRQVIGAGAIEIYSQRFRPGAHDVSTSHGLGAREHVYIISGRVALGPEGEQVELGPGDYATYPADRVHHWHVLEGEPDLLIVNTLPRGTTFAE